MLVDRLKDQKIKRRIQYQNSLPMKSSLPSLSSPCLPKITSQHLEQLIKSKKKPEIISTELCRRSYKHHDKIPPQRSLRLTDAGNRLDNNKANHDSISQHLDIKSPFYQRMSVKHLGKWKCNCHQNKENSSLPRLRQTHCSHHDQIIAQKHHFMKKFHESIVSNRKENHVKNHEAIERIKSEYLNYSHENSIKIKEQKAKLTEKNKEQNQNRLEKTIKEAHMQKQLNMTLLKQRLDDMYNLDNQNEPFERVLLKRNRWETKRNVWKEKILTIIQKRLKRAQEIQAKIQKMNKSKMNGEGSSYSTQNKLLNGTMTKMSQTKIKFADKQNQKMLQDIETCLGVLMKNVSSVSDLIPKYQSKQIKARISEIFKKNLNIQNSHYVKKLRKMMGEIIEEIVVEQTQAKLRKTKNSIYNKVNSQQLTLNECDASQTYQKSQKSHSKTKNKIISAKSVKSFNTSVTNLDQRMQIKQKETANQKSALQMKAEQSLLSTSLLSNTFLTPINEEYTINIEQKKFPDNKKYSILSGKSSSSHRKHSGNSKLSFMSNSLKRSSMMSTHRKNTSGNDSSKEKSEHDNSPKKTDQNQDLNHLTLTKHSMSSSYNIQHMAPSLSKQVICEKEELQMQSDDQNLEQQLRTARALKYYKSARQQEQQMQKIRIDEMINLMKQKIINKKQGSQSNEIPQKYLKIKYDSFCSDKTFKYIVSMVQGFQGVRRFKFIYSQLRAKKKILNDIYLENLIKEFKPMIGDDKELEEFKEFIFDCRTKIMFDSLNHLIDSGMQVMEQAVEQVQEKEVKVMENEPGTEEAEIPKECMIFKKIDESQIAFERYMQKLQRKNQKQTEPKRLGLGLSIAIPQLFPQQKQQQPQVSQKTIHSDIQTNSTKHIRYTVIDHSAKSSLHKSKFDLNDSSMIDIKDMKYKKKVLGYLLRKNPQQFQQLNKNLNEVSKLFGSRVDEGERDERPMDSLGEILGA